MNQSFFIAGLIIVFYAASCATQEQAADKKTVTADSTAMAVVTIPVAYGPLTNTLNAYYKVKDAFTRTDGTAADMAAMQLRLSVDSLNPPKMEMDSPNTSAITGYKKALLSTIDEMIKERDIQKKRMLFATLSNNLYNLAKTTPYRGETVYRLHCPMAFDKGADWLSNQAVVANPYFGSKMMECGEVKDSLPGK